jgi:hypothetical protein
VLIRFEKNNRDDWLLAHFVTLWRPSGDKFGEQITDDSEYVRI